MNSTNSFRLFPVGLVLKTESDVRIRIYPEYAGAMPGLEQFSHILALWWFHENDNARERGTLRVHPRGDKKNPLTGVFATRSPARPNLIAVTPCRIERIEEADIIVDDIDAFHHTPVIDVKPYFPLRDPDAVIRTPEWAK